MISFRQILEGICSISDGPNCTNGAYLQSLTRNNVLTTSAKDLEPMKGCSKCKWGHIAQGYPKDYIDCHRPYVDQDKPNCIKQPETCDFWETKDENF